MRLRLSTFDKLALSAWAGLAAVAFCVKAGWLSFAAVEGPPILCPFRLITGHPCPGCGMMRAVILAFEGEWADSFKHHPLGIPLLAVWTLWILYGLRNSKRGRPFSDDFPLAIEGALPGAAVVSLIFAIYIYRLKGGL